MDPYIIADTSLTRVDVWRRAVNGRAARNHVGRALLIGRPIVGAAMILVASATGHWITSSRVVRVLSSESSLFVETRNSIYELRNACHFPPAQEAVAK